MTIIDDVLMLTALQMGKDPRHLKSTTMQYDTSAAWTLHYYYVYLPSKRYSKSI